MLSTALGSRAIGSNPAAFPFRVLAAFSTSPSPLTAASPAFRALAASFSTSPSLLALAAASPAPLVQDEPFPQLVWARRYGSSASSAPPAAAAAPTNAYGSSLPEVVARAGWEGAWREGTTPWEMRAGHRLLRHLGAPHFGGPLPRGAILVPGAGAGRDAVELAKAFAAGPGAPATRVLGVDVSPTAVARGAALVAADVEAAELAREGRLELREADFFTMPVLRSAPRFAAVFDYTFLSALPPTGSARAQWADSCARLLEPGGEVVAIVFPVDDFAGGPPFAMRPESVRELLVPRGFRERLLVPLPRELSHSQRAGREWLARYAKEDIFPTVRERT